jgi:nucleotide-binding universal stress UspA family protein
VLDPWCAVARLKHVTCKALVQEGNTASLIAATALHLQADRVLLGTRSRGRLSKLLIGSVAEQVLRSVQLPVMTLGPETHSTPQEEAESSSRQRVVLLATTLHEASRPSAALACRIAASQGARLVLLHVLPPIDEMKREGLPTGLDSAAMCELRTLADETGTHCCSCVEPIVVHGTPVIEILATAAEQHASLIVLGSTARSSFESFTRDRTIYRVLAHARCPVLTLRAPASALTEADTKRLTMRS